VADYPVELVQEKRKGKKRSPTCRNIPPQTERYTKGKKRVHALRKETSLGPINKEETKGALVGGIGPFGGKKGSLQVKWEETRKRKKGRRSRV